MDAENNFSLTGLIDDYIEARDPKEFDSWRASSIGQCPRAHTYKRLDIPSSKERNKRKHRVFEAGHVFHKFIQDIADSTGHATQIEAEIYDKELDLGGRYDLLIEADGKRILYDIKTCHSYKFTHLDEQGGADHHHKMQLAAYMLLLKRAKTPVDEGRILYVSKDDLRTLDLSYQLTKELEDDVIAEVNLLNKHWAEKTIPPCWCGKEPVEWQLEKGYCDYCDESKYEWRDKMKDGKAETYKSGATKREKVFTSCCPESLFKEEN